MPPTPADPSSPRRHWALDPDVVFLNHGSFGACPVPVLRAQQRLRDRMERQPVRFFVRELESLLDEARSSLAGFLGCRPRDLAWVPNATSGVNAVLRSFRLRAGDELLTTDHAYNACRNALEFVVRGNGARVVAARVPFPVVAADRIVDTILERVTPRTRLALLDHVTSQTGLILPIERLVRELEARGVATLVDGAHAPGMLALSLDALGASYYTGNCHKWICAPKGAGFLYVRADRQASVRPPVISHGANSERADRSRFLLEFDWMGTDDPTAVLCVPQALRFMSELLPGGWPALRRQNHERVVYGRRVLCRALGIEPPCPEEMLGSLASLPLPAGSVEPPNSPLYSDPLQDELLERWAIEVPVIPWPEPPRRLIRISAQAYNRQEDYETLSRALAALFA